MHDSKDLIHVIYNISNIVEDIEFSKFYIHIKCYKCEYSGGRQ